MIALTLAAGMGKRMGDLCLRNPKTMIEFLGKTLLSRQEKLFLKKGIKHCVVTGYQSSSINFHPTLMRTNKDFSTTNMMYSLRCARDLILEAKSEDVIVSYGDIIYQENVLDELINETRGDIQLCADKNFLALWSARMNNPLDDLESFKTDETTDYITDIGRKANVLTEIEAQYIGLFKISKHFIHNFFEFYESLLVKDNKYKSLAMTDFIQLLIGAGAKVRPVYIQGGWLEFDTGQDFEKYNFMLKTGELEKIYVD